MHFADDGDCRHQHREGHQQDRRLDGRGYRGRKLIVVPGFGRGQVFYLLLVMAIRGRFGAYREETEESAEDKPKNVAQRHAATRWC